MSGREAQRHNEAKTGIQEKKKAGHYSSHLAGNKGKPAPFLMERWAMGE
jgi:hypothetical protein